jgi:putative oxidoreductase
MIDLIGVYARLTSHAYRSWYAIPLRLIVGFGFMEHGYAKIARGPEKYASILQALGVPAPDLLAWVTIFIELLGGLVLLCHKFHLWLLRTRRTQCGHR